MMTLEKNDARMVRWSSHVSPGDRISSVQLRNRLQLNNMREYLQNKKLSRLERMRDNVWSGKYGTSKAAGHQCRRSRRKTWNEVIRSDLKESKFSKDLECFETIYRKL